MAAGISFSLIVCFLVCSSIAQKIITAEKTTGFLGQEVILPCEVPNKFNINNIRAVEWSRPDQDSEYVLSYRDGRLDPDDQYPSYQNRVDLQDKEMKDGNVSLILKNVTKEDTGIYECRVFEKGKIELICSFNLEVVEPAQKIISAELGQDVILPCKVPNINNNKTIRAVGWSRPELDPEYVLYYQDGHLNFVNQHPSYQNRVDLQDKEMKDRDVSLILKNVMMEDNGRYECLVFGEGKNEPISIINLEVHLSGEKDGGDQVGIITGSVVGMIIFLLIAAAAVGFLIHRRSKGQNQHVSVPLDERTISQMF